MDYAIGVGIGTVIIFILVMILITIALVAFWTWFITKIAIETHDRHRKKYGSQELDLLNTQICQNKNILTALLQIKNNTDQLNKTIDKLDNRIDNILLNKRTPHM